MTHQQYDVLHSTIIKQNDLITKLVDKIEKLIVIVNKLESKTLVISSIDTDITELKLAVKMLKDEAEA